jgi:hypothetical protein
MSIAATSSIFDGGLNIIGTNYNNTVTIPDNASAAYADVISGSGSFLYDGGLNIFGINGTTASGSTLGIYLIGLTNSALGTTGPSASIFDGGLNIIGQYDPINYITSIPTL